MGHKRIFFKLSIILFLLLPITADVKCNNINSNNSSIVESKKTVVLPMNIVGEKNILTQDMFYKGPIGNREPNTNTIFVVKYNYDLNDFQGNSPITIPARCTLKFEGGSINNGKIIFSLTKIEGNAVMNVMPAGFIDGTVSATWFGLKANDRNFDNGPILTRVGQTFSNIFIDGGDYYCNSPIDWSTNNITQLDCRGTLRYITANTSNTFITLRMNKGHAHFYDIIGPNDNIADSDNKEKSTGIRFYDCNNSDITIERAIAFQTCIEIFGGKHGNSYNNYHFQHVMMGKNLVKLTKGIGGWVNSNNYWFNRLTNYGGTTEPEAAITFTSEDNSMFDANDNYIHECNIEGITKDAPIHLNRMTGTLTIDNIRNEDNNDYFLKVIGYASDITMNFLYGINQRIKYERENGQTGHMHGIRYKYNGVDIPFNSYEVQSSEYTKGNDFVYAPPFLTIEQGKKLPKDAFMTTNGRAFIFFPKDELEEKITVLYNAKGITYWFGYVKEDGTILKTNSSLKPILRNDTQLGSSLYYHSGLVNSENIYIPKLPSDVAYVAIGICRAKTSSDIHDVFPKLEISATASSKIHSHLNLPPNAVVNSGTTANRPVLGAYNIGLCYFDTDLGKPIWWSGDTKGDKSGWVDANGRDMPN